MVDQNVSHQARRQSNKLLLILTLCASAPALIFYFIASPPAINLIWDWANALGYAAATMMMLLFIYSGQKFWFPEFTGKFFVNLHRHMSYAAVFLTSTHMIVHLLNDPILIEHLKLSGPFYMLSGLIATILLVVLTFSSVQVIRKKISSDYKLFRTSHAILATLTILLIYVHIVYSHYYVNTFWKTAFWSSISFAILIFYIKNRSMISKNNLRTLRTDIHTPIYISYVGCAALCMIALAIATIHNI